MARVALQSTAQGGRPGRYLRGAPRKPGASLAVDNTFATPLNQQPLRLGADISMHSATKFIGGHSDLLAGMLAVRDATLLDSLRKSRTLGGATPGTLEAWLAVRGLRTLALRFERAQQNAQALAEWLETHPQVEAVRYPGLRSHPGSRTGDDPARRLRHHDLVRCRGRCGRRRRRVPGGPVDSPRLEPGCGRIHHGAAGRECRPGTPAADRCCVSAWVSNRWRTSSRTWNRHCDAAGGREKI